MERISRALQENILTLLTHSNEHGKLIYQKIKPELFENDYRVIAEEAIGYWNKYKKAPADDMDGLLAEILEDRENRRAPTYRRILVQMIELADTINAEYTINSINDFIEMQEVKAALVASYEQMKANPELGTKQAKDIWANLLKVRHDNFHPGMRMTEIVRLTTFLENQTTEFVTGIDVFDKAHIVPIRKKIMLFLAPSGRGKTWFLVNVSKKALMLRKKVLFVSLEMDEEEIIQRMYQALFAASKREASSETVRFKLNEIGRLEDFEFKKYRSEFSFDSPTLREELETRLIQAEYIMSNFVVKRFPPRSIDVDGINAFMDNLEWNEGFIPDMTVVDYMGRIKTNINQHRLALGTQLEEYRGMCITRNQAGVTAMQVNRAGTDAKEVGSMHVAEDVSFVNTSDNILTQSQTKIEKQLDICRVSNTKARGEKDEMTALISRNLELGQYCTQSIPFNKRYFELLKEYDPEVEEEVYDNEDA